MKVLPSRVMADDYRYGSDDASAAHEQRDRGLVAQQGLQAFSCAAPAVFLAIKVVNKAKASSRVCREAIRFASDPKS